MCGDISIQEQEQLMLQYLGTVPTHSKSSIGSTAGASVNSGGSAPDIANLLAQAAVGVPVRTLGREQQLGVYLPDSDERAMGYLAGPAPNRWGYYADGEKIADKMMVASNSNKRDSRRDHPLFGHVALLILQEVNLHVNKNKTQLKIFTIYKYFCLFILW